MKCIILILPKLKPKLIFQSNHSVNKVQSTLIGFIFLLIYLAYQKSRMYFNIKATDLLANLCFKPKN